MSPLPKRARAKKSLFLNLNITSSEQHAIRNPIKYNRLNKMVILTVSDKGRTSIEANE